MRNSAPRRMIPIVALTLTLALCVQAPYVALADDTGSSSAGSADAVAQSDSSSSVIAQSDSSSSVVAQSDSSSSVVAQTDDSSSSSAQAAEVSAPVAEQAPVSAQAAEEDGWHSDAGGTYYVRGGSRVVSAWLVLEVAPSGEKVGWQRYWVGADGYLAKGRLVTETESGRWAYAESDGSIARGRYVDSATGYVYLADNDGRLESPGWHVTSAYGSGLQRYWVDSTAHACVPGYSADGWAHYTTSAGYVLRGTYTDPATGYVYLANNDGLLAGPGWVVADYGSGLQRYWVDSATHACVPGYSTDGWAHYTTSAGYVLRGTCTDPSTGYVYLANNDGLLAGPGWVVADYGSGLQRYWVDSATHACVPGYSTDGWAHYTTSAGYVARGAYAANGVVYLANNDGLLAGPGWVVGDYGDGVQRYWVDATAHACIPGYSTDGWAHYTTDWGYVARGSYAAHGVMYIADNDGLLAGPGWVVGDYGYGVQRYWVDATAHACVPGYSKDGWAHWTTDWGYVLRGSLRYDSDGILVADNDGKLAECYSSGGWLVTSAFTGSLERYRIDDCCGGILGAHAGSFSLDGNSYYGTSSGYVARNTNVVVGGGFYHADNDGILTEIDVGGDYAMWAKAQGYTSDTNYLILINCSDHLVGVYYGGFMNWSNICMYSCGNGKDSTPTVKGSFTVGVKGYSFGEGYTCYYYTQFYGNYLLHSILYYENTWNVMDGRLGMGVSHGCVRLAPENAKWIYDNVPRGSRVISY